MSFAQPIASHDRPLTLRDVLVPLIKSGLVEAQEAEKWLKLWARSGEHPLTLIADATIPDRRSPGKNSQPPTAIALPTPGSQGCCHARD